MKLKKEDFDCGSPYSSWLKEELLGEVCDLQNGFENSGLIEKNGVVIDDYTESIIMGIKKLDDLPDGLRKTAIDIIRMKLDDSFMLKYKEDDPITE